jgi:CRP-like cAMP-binding protein
VKELRDRKRRRLAALRRIPLFADCTRGQLRRIDRLGAVVRRPAGDVLVTAGMVGRECLFVLDGSLAVSRGSGVVAVVGPGALVGEMALLSGAPRNATVMALTDVEVLVLHPGEFSELLAIPAVAEAIRSEVARRATPVARLAS